MISATVNITADAIAAPEHNPDGQLYADGLEAVGIELPGEDGAAEVTCRECGAELERDGVTWVSDPGGADCEAADEDECPTCEGTGTGREFGPDGYETGCETCAGTGSVPGSHVAEPTPFGWANSARIHLSEDGSEITLTVSIGDPRGGISMTARRMDDGTILLHVPTLDRVKSHMHYATVAHEGTFILA